MRVCHSITAFYMFFCHFPVPKLYSCMDISTHLVVGFFNSVNFLCNEISHRFKKLNEGRGRATARQRLAAAAASLGAFAERTMIIGFPIKTRMVMVFQTSHFVSKWTIPNPFFNFHWDFVLEQRKRILFILIQTTETEDKMLQKNAKDNGVLS